MQIYLRIYFYFDAIHFGISLFIVSSIYKYFIKYFVKARNIWNFSLDHHLLLFIIQPHKFWHWFNRPWKFRSISGLAKFSDNSITTQQRYMKNKHVLWETADISISTERNFLSPMSHMERKKFLLVVVKPKRSACTRSHNSDGHITKQQTLATQSQLPVPY